MPKRQKKQNKVIDYLAYITLRLIAVFLQLADVNTALRIARLMGNGLFCIYHRGRKRAIENLRLSYPEKSEKWIEQTRPPQL